MSRRLEVGTGRFAVLGGCLCLALACGRSPVLRGDDGAAGGGDAGSGDGALERVTPPPPPDGAIDRSSDAQDALDGRPDSSLDVVDAPPDVVDAPVEARTDGPATCPVDCSHLPHVRAGLFVGCSSAGVCVLPPLPCDDGFAHCSANPNDGCEADLSKPTSCGSCFNTCYAPYSSCSKQSGYYYCGPVCAAPTPDPCYYYSCVDFQSDPSNCGGCGHSCYLPNAVASCVQGQCTLAQCSDPSYADCTSDPGCETLLGTDLNCAGCGDKSCALANTVRTCTSANACASAVCAAGYANCDATSADCEASFATGGGACLPRYLGTIPLAVQVLNDAAAVIATDGSTFLAGGYTGLVDFDPTAGQDIRTTATADDVDGFITKINADGSYAWTRTFAGRGFMSLHGLAAAAGGAVVAVGSYQDSVDLDPGASADLHQTAMISQTDALAVKLGADGSFVWGKTFSGTDYLSTSDAFRVAVDGTDAVYLAGSFQSTVDFDPGAGTASRTSPQISGTLVKLTAAGAFSWVQTIDDGPCSASLSSVAVGTDGAVWSVGSADTSSYCALGSPTGQSYSSSSEALIVSYSAAGVSRGTWSVGGGLTQVYGSGVTAGPNGSVYIGGQSAGVVDFDPGPGQAMRWTSQFSGGFILKLGSDAGFSWVQTIPDVSIVSVAGTSDGGVLAAGFWSGAFVTRLGADGTAVWTFASGGPATSPQTVAARGTSFVVAGFNNGSGDFDPGAGIDIVFGDIVYLSRFSF